MEAAGELELQELKWLGTPAEDSKMFEVKDKLDNKLSPDGYNIGVNVGWAAGQTIFHLISTSYPATKATFPTSGVGSEGSRKALCPTWWKENKCGNYL